MEPGEEAGVPPGPWLEADKAEPSAIKTTIPRSRERKLVRRLLSRGFQNHRVMHLDHAVDDEIEERWQQSIDDAWLLYKLDLDRQMTSLQILSLMTVLVMMLPEAGFRPHHCCTCHSAREKQREHLFMNEATPSTRVFVQVNRDFFRGAWL